MKYLTLSLWYLVGAVVNLLCEMAGLPYIVNYILGIIVGAVGSNIHDYKSW